MNHRTLTEQLVEIERRCDVNALRHHGLRVWPVMRLAIWQCIGGPASQFLRLPGPDIKSTRFILSPRSQAALTARPAQIGPAGQEQAGPGPDFLLFSASGYYTDRCNGLAYNRHVDPLLDLFGETWNMVPLELAEGQRAPALPRKYPGLTINYTTQCREVPVSKAGVITGFDSFRHTTQAVLGEEVSEARFLEELITLRAWRALYTQILQALQPRCVGIVCYYHVQAMGLAWACRSLGIPCVDLQHGKQGKYHGMYTHWTCMPPEGYELMPDHFWMWGEESRQNLTAGLPEDRTAPVVFTAGNPWLTLWLDGPGCEPPPEALHRLEARCAGRHPVLVSLQPLAEPLPPALLQVMLQSSPSWLWLLRLHPRNASEAGPLAAWLAEKGVRNVEVTLANEMPLYSLLKRSVHHVTGFSSVAYEALQFGLSSTLFHPTALDLYPTYLECGHFRYADRAETILHSVARGIVEPKRQEHNPYILHGQERMRQCLASLRSGKPPCC
ncbi:hypothetical protein [Megalodesulfovibrio paquesii]